MKTFSLKKEQCQHNWYLINCEDQILGRISTEIARILQNKNTATYTPNMKRYGNHIVLINCDKIKFTGNKLKDKIYYKHTGYIGHLKETTLEEKMQKDPREVIEKSVYGMLPRCKSRKHMMRRLHIYVGNNHNHQGQTPTDITQNIMDNTGSSK